MQRKLEAQNKKSGDRSLVKPKGQPSIIPAKDKPNPQLNETYEPINSHLSMMKTFKGHL